MTQTQRRVIEAIIRRAERGPSLGSVDNTADAERGARIWSESWVADPLKALIDNADGKISAAQLSLFAN